MKKEGLIKEGYLGNAQTLIFKMKDCRKVIEKFLKGKMKNFEGCKKCNIRPRTIPTTVKSDWSEKNKRVKPDTSAFICKTH